MRTPGGGPRSVEEIGASLVWLPANESAESDTGGRRVDAGPTTAVDFPAAVDNAVSHMAGGDELPETRTPALREAVTQLRRDGEATADAREALDALVEAGRLINTETEGKYEVNR